MSKRKSTLADRISTILTAAPATDLDPENDPHDQNPLIRPHTPDDEDDLPDPTTSTIRRQNLHHLSDLDAKYSGKTSNRKNIFHQDSDESDSYHGEEDSNHSEEDSCQGDEDGWEGKQDGSEGDEDSCCSDEVGSDGDEDGSYGDEVEDEGEGFSNFKNLDVDGERRKGQHVQNQLKIWESLLEIRIQLQKSLAAANCMPQGEVYRALADCEEFKKGFVETKKSVIQAFSKLFELQDVFAARIKDEEEILSDDEEEDEGPVKKKVRREVEFERDLAENFANFKDYRNKTIQKWNDKTNLAAKKTADSSILKQIEFNLANSQKLVEKSRIKRTDFKILGVEDREETSNVNVYDDSDFYHQLLRELIEVKSADLTDPVQLGRQWIQLQNLRSKMKRKIDTKATKGRKIRFAVHTKLVNFMAPIDATVWTDEAKDELYTSLFGKRQISAL